MLLSEAAQKYLTACLVEGKTLATRDSYERNLRSFMAAAGDIPVSEIDGDVIQHHLADMMKRSHFGHALSSDTIHKRYSVIRSFMNYLEKHGHIDHNPISKMKPPKLDQKLPKFLSDQQIAQMISNLENKPRDRTIIMLFLTTGCRLFEAANLTIDDLNFDQNYIKVKGKGKKEGIVPMSAELKNEMQIYLRKYREPIDKKERRVFISDAGTPLTRAGMQIVIRRALWAIGVNEKVGPHILRHTFATRYLRKGGNLEVLRKILRHSTITTTMIYTHLNQEDVRDDYARTGVMSDIIRKRKR